MTNFSNRHKTGAYFNGGRRKLADGGPSDAVRAYASDPSLGPTGTAGMARGLLNDAFRAAKQVKATYPGAKTTSDFQREQGEDIMRHVPHDKRGGRIKGKRK